MNYRELTVVFVRFNNPEKGAIQHSIIHRLVRDYMTLCTSLADNDKRRADLFESYVCLLILFYSSKLTLLLH